MQSLYLLGRGSSDCRGGGGGGGGILPLPSSRKLASFVGIWAGTYGRARRPSDGAGPVKAAAAGGDQDHYSVLGISRTASSGDIKKAYRLLARKYHPDVSQDLQAGEVFKSIRLAYEVLSDEVARARYDMSLKFLETRGNSWRRRWAHNPESDETSYRWDKLRQHMHYERKKREQEETSWYYQTNSRQETSDYERGSFTGVLRFAFFTLFFMQMVGVRASLTLCGAAALLDRQLDVGYKMGYVVAWLFGGRGGILLALCIYFASWLCGKKSSSLVALVVAWLFGGRGGILLALCIYFASWLCGKKSSSLVALVVLAMWVGANIARFAPLPQGAVLTLLYMSIKLHVNSK